MPRWTRSGSAICSPTRISGFSELAGSWKTIAIAVPHTSAQLARRCGRRARRRRSGPSPIATTSGPDSRPMIERLSTVLPEPDSPTMPTRLAAFDRQATPRRRPAPARARVRKWVTRSVDLEQRGVTSRSSDRRSPDVEAAGEPVADEVEREHREEQHQAREDRRPPASDMALRFSSISLPHVGVGASTLRPRNASAALGGDEDAEAGERRR